MSRNAYGMSEKIFNVDGPSLSKSKSFTLEFKATFKKKGILLIDVLDDLGRSRHQKKLTINSGSATYSLDVSKFKAGKYNAWLSFGGQTIIKPITIAPKPKSLTWKMLFS
jgi:hypothetical protein